MKRAALFLLPLVAFVALAAFLLRGLWLNPREVPSPLIGKAAPVFERAQLDKTTELWSSTSLAGKVWILNVWASWCAPCRVEHPLFNELAQQKLVPIVGLNYKDMPDNARKWLAELGNPFDVTVIDFDGRVGIDFGVYGVPETFVIDREGVIRYKHTGPVTPEAMRDKIMPLLRKLQ